MKKFLNFLLVLIILISNAFAGLPPTTLSGVADATKTTTFNYKVPNKQSTPVSGGTLIETGNDNLLADPSFESTNPLTNWSITPTPSTNVTNVPDGKIALDFSPSAVPVEIKQDVTMNAAAFADGVQGLAMAMVKTTMTTLQVCPRRAGAIVSSLCVTVPSTGKWTLVKVPFILGATSNGISINSPSYGNVTGTFSIDKMFVGAVDLKADTPVVQTQGLYSFGISGTTNLLTSGTPVMSGSGLFTVSGNTLTALKTIKVDASISTAMLSSGVGNYVNPSIDSASDLSLATSSGQNLLADAVVSKIIQQGQTLVFGTAGSPNALTTYIYITAQSVTNTSIYTSTNANTPWTAFTPTGSWTSGVTYSGLWRRVGGDMEIQYKVAVSGAVTAGNLLLNMPTGYSVDAARLAHSTSVQLLLPSSSSTFWDLSATTDYVMFVLYNSPTTFFVAYPSNVNDALGITSNTLPIVPAAGDVYTVNVKVPIVGWDDTNFIIGQFSGLETCADTFQCTDTYSATISSTGVISNPNVAGWLTGCTLTGGSSPFTCTFKSGLFTVAPNCSITGSRNGGIIGGGGTILTSATSVQFAYRSAADAYFADNGVIFCQKQGADFLGKTAKAVASDQNVSTPGLLKSVAYSAVIGSTGVIVQQNGNWISSCTSATASVCSFNANVFAANSATYPICVTQVDTVAGDWCFTSAVSNTSMTVTCFNASGTAEARQKRIICHGQAP